MTDINAAASGQFTLGDIRINRLGYGAMRIVGEGIWGPPADKKACLETLRRLPELGVNFIDTADSYGPDISEELIREALSPFDGLLIATKGGFTRHGPNVWKPVGRPEYLRQTVLMSLRKLGLEQIGLWQLHRVDPLVPEDEQFGVIAEMQKEGLIRHVGLSEVSIDQIKKAQRYFSVVSVQNMFNLVTRTHEGVLDYCSENNIGFIPWFPLGAGDLAKPGSLLDKLSREKNCSPSQIALAWVLKRSPVLLPIPGTGKVKHLEENVAAASVQLTDEEFKLLDRLGREAPETQGPGA
ncbi:oxidoreductase (plasmid) [Raoultella ornithinolytica]|uniref:aldo/keto reductase n=1 Tax=Raoultella ornithinolytica TaxID=54291 RepID=UPI000849EFDC|nr:aldo/keto reductase [Raoultella ornithinolytica]AOO59866.1 oxidoreductase [Raoultella ornithinolytica]